MLIMIVMLSPSDKVSSGPPCRGALIIRIIITIILTSTMMILIHMSMIIMIMILIMIMINKLSVFLLIYTVLIMIPPGYFVNKYTVSHNFVDYATPRPLIT